MRTDSAKDTLSTFLIGGIHALFADKTIDDDGDNDVYETIEFSDSSSHVYTEPIRDYGVLRKVNIKTSPRQQQAGKKATSGLKKSAGSRNLQKFKAMQDVSEVTNENEPIQLRVKPNDAIPADRSSKPAMSLISVGLHNTSTCGNVEHESLIKLNFF